MADKQIIIDVCPYQGECSVSGCKRNDDGCFVRQLFEERDRAENRIVELNKTIQAKEQECETLASQLDFEVQKKECLEQECEELKEKVKKYGEINEQETKDYAELKAENDELKKIIERLDVPKHEVIDMDIALENEKLKQTLTEIKEIAKETINSSDCYERMYGGFCARPILRKISEVEDDNK